MSIQINGHRSSPIQIRSSVRQGCPISMQLFAMCLNPLLCTLEKNLAGIQIGWHRVNTTVVDYADDVTIFATSPMDIPKIQEALHCFEKASGVKINIRKSRALAISPWDTSVRIMNIPYHSEAKILGFHIVSKVQDSANKSWSKTTARIRALAQEAYYRDMSFDKRIQFVHDYMLAKAWYIAQIYPLPDKCVRRLNTMISWYVWRGEIFRVPLSTLQRRKDEGRWDLIHLAAKSSALFLNWLDQQGLRSGTLTAEWLCTWGLLTQQEPALQRPDTCDT